MGESGVKSMYIDSEWPRIDRGVRQGCIMYHWLFNVYMDGLMKEVKMGMWKRGVRFLKDGREWRLPDILYAGDFVGSIW